MLDDPFEPSLTIGLHLLGLHQQPAHEFGLLQVAVVGERGDGLTVPRPDRPQVQVALHETRRVWRGPSRAAAFRELQAGEH